MIDAFGVDRISKGLRVDLPVDWVDKLTDSQPRQKKFVKAVADQMSHPEYGYNKPVEIAFSRKHNNVIDLNKPNDGLKLRLQNGHHRLEAHKQLGRKKIYTDITLRRQDEDLVGDQQRRVPDGTGFGPNKNTIHVSQSKPPTFSRKNAARIVSPKKDNNQPLIGEEIPRMDYNAKNNKVSKSGIGAGRYMRAIDMPPKIRARQIARLKAGKPQVASVQDQIFARVSDDIKLGGFNTRLGIPKNKGTVLNVGRKKHKVLIHNNKRMKNSGIGGYTTPNLSANTNHIVVPNKLKTTGKQANTIEHEKAHAQKSPQHIIRNVFRNRNAKFGEEARADAMANLKTGRRTIPSSYPTANNRRYTEVYTMITGRKPKMTKVPKSQRKSPSKQKKIDDQIGRSISASFARRSPGPEYQSVRKPNLP